MNDFGGNSYAPDYEVTQDDKTWGLIAHLSPIAGSIIGLAPVGPLVVWLIKKEQSKFVAKSALEALAFSVGVFVFFVAFFIVAFALTCLGGIGVLLFPVGGLIGIAYIVYIVIGAIRANEGKIYEYPLTSKFVKQ